MPIAPARAPHPADPAVPADLAEPAELEAEGREDDLAVVIRSIARAKTAAPLVSELVAALGWEPDRLQDALAEAEVAGLVDPWPECEAGCAVVLSALAADRLGLQLVGGETEASTSGRFALRWLPAGSRPRARKVGRLGKAGVEVTLESDLDGPDGPASLDDLADPRSQDPGSYTDGLIWFESKRRSAPPGGTGWTPQELLARGFLKFVHLVGLRERWDGEQYDVKICGSCGDRPMTEMEVCLRCNRSGLDALIRPSPRPKRTQPPKPKASTAKGKQGKATRRARRAAARC
jgi:hypothetical protein